MSHDITGRSLSMRAVFLVMLFAAYYCGSTLLVHSHNTWHGVVTHSHPYSPKAHHSHMEYEFETLSVLNNIVTEEMGGSPLVAPAEHLLQMIEPVVADCEEASEIKNGCTRAPPYYA
ncbi:MAG: hypothetical protein NC082_07035 [Clostridiales bacterium]|nr:hypothetical protein [Clostridiales bacterium]